MFFVEKLGQFYQSQQSIELQNCCVANVTHYAGHHNRVTTHFMPWHCVVC